MKRTLLASAIVAGALAGAAGAAVQAQPPPAPTPAPPVATPAPTPIPVDSARVRGRLPDGRYSPSWVHYRTHGKRIAVRLPDPAGGPAWALQVFDAERLTIKKPSRTLKGARVVGRNRCVQLGRLRGDEFGWVYGDGRFRRVTIEDQLLQCTSRKRPVPIGQMVNTIKIVDPAAPALAGTVVWGLLPGAAQAVVSGTGGADGAAAVRDGAFLRIAGPEGRPSAGAQVAGGGKRVDLTPGNRLPARFLGRMRFPTPDGAQIAEAPAPDPAGGPRWGVAVVPTREGVPCVGGPTRVVADRSGGVDLRLATFTEGLLSSQSCRPLGTKPSAERPCDIGSGFGNAEELEGDDGFLERARVERRLLAGRSTVWAQCAENVERVTLRTPRDIRTLVPSAVGRAILAVYDGDFVDGELEFVAHLRGGRRWTQKFPLGGI